MVATSAQIRAANPQISAHVSANAGTGKTHVLTQRVLRLLLSGVQPGRIVCLTYTRTAAAEMSERITSTLQKWAKLPTQQLEEQLLEICGVPPTAEEVLLARQLFPAVLNSMPPPRIQTIHSFCQEILGRFPLEAGLMPYFSVIDEVSAKEMLTEAKQQLLHEQNKSELLEAVKYIAANASEKWLDDLLREVISGRNKFREYFESGLADFSGEYHDAEILEDQFLNYSPSDLEQIVAAWKSNLNKTHLERLENLSTYLTTKKPQDYASIFCTDKGESYAMRSIMAAEQLKKNPVLREMIEAEQARIQAIKEQVRQIKTNNLTMAAQQIALSFITVYDKLKARQNVLDYEDLVFYTKRLFLKTDSAAWILYKLDAGIDHILVDEAQDASPSQWAIINKIAAEFFAGETAQTSNRTMFIVGDEKQSIYSFQGAEPKNLREVSNKFHSDAVEAGKAWHKIPLDLSFRSVGTIMQFVDAVFNQPEIKQAVSFSEDEILHEAHRQGTGMIELWPLIEKQEFEEPEPWELPVKSFKAFSAEAELADKIAKTIKKWLLEGRALPAQGGRVVQPSDIIILLRKRTKLADLLVRKLKENHIPVAGSDRLKLNEHIAIQDLIALTDFYLLPSDDLAFACALKSPIFGVSEQTLFEIAYDRGNKSLFEVLQNDNKYNELLGKIQALREVSAASSPYEFYNHLINNANYREAFLRRMGEEVNDPLDEFLGLAIEYETKHSRSIQNFVHWFKSSDYEIKRDMEARSSEVRVMTVHAAKGLQAPIVFLPDTTGQIISSQKAGKVFWQGEEKFWAMDKKGDASAEVVELIDAKSDAEKEEYLRLLYVAVTRAADELYVCGTKPKNLPQGCWYDILQKTLAEIGQKDGDVLRYGNAPSHAVGAQQQLVRADSALPEFLKAKLPELQKPELERVSTNIAHFAAINRGVRIHKFFEHYNSRRAAIAKELAQEYLQDDELVNEVLAVVAEPEFGEIFAENSMAEVAIVSDGEVMKLDRLVLSEEAAVIVDFKTGVLPQNGVPAAYVAQLQKYAAAVQKLHPSKKVTAKILWTGALKLQDVPLDNRSQ